MLIVGIVLAVGWPVAIAVSWANIVSSHARLGYLFGDLTLVTPLAFIGWYGLTHSRAWGPKVFLLFAGAGAFDTLHFGIYLIQEKFLNIPALIYIALILVALAVLVWFSLWEIRVQTAPPPAVETARPADSVTTI